jgi:hypothetical protein
LGWDQSLSLSLTHALAIALHFAYQAGWLLATL